MALTCSEFPMFQTFKKSPGHQDAINQIKEWVRNTFSLSNQAVIAVAEISCQVPGCPPVETIIAFWNDDNTRYRIKLFKPLEEVLKEDLPLSWLLPSLQDDSEGGCDCC
ncbi:hypothetical protein HX777_10110 [Pseudomonas agarici]|nr:hypothetical protein [Pseudomonas agarici]